MTAKNFNYSVEFLFRRKKSFLETAGVVLIVVVGATLLWPPVYESTAKILVQDNRAQLLVSPDLQHESTQNPAIVTNPVSEADLNSEVELLTSIYLIRQAVTGLQQQQNDSASRYLGQVFGFALRMPDAGYRLVHDSPALTSRDAWILKLAGHTYAWPIKRSNVIEVSFRSHDPRWTHEFLTRLINGYLDYHVRLSQDPQAAKFFDQQAELLNSRLKDSEEQLRQLEVQTGITSLPAQKQALVNQIADLQNNYNRVVANLASAQRQQETLQRQVAGTPQRIGKEERSVQNLALEQIKPEVMKLESERAELLTRYQPDSKRIAEIDARLAAAQRILEHENHLEVQEVATDLNPVWVTLKSNLDQADGNVASLQADRNTYSTELAAAHQQLTDMVNNGLEIERRQRRVETDKETYLAYVRKGEEARAAQELNLSKILNVSVEQEPTEPLEPTLPKVWLNLVAGIVWALIAGVLAAWWEEERDEKLYSAATIEKVSGVSTVAILRNEA
jgi:polysaccharide biosynthesis protein PslE